MSRSPDKFEKQSPQKVYISAQNYSKTLHRFHQLPKAMSKSMMVKQLAENKKEEIKFTIQQSKYQAELFRKLEADDMQNRSKLQKKIQSKIEAALENNEKQIEKRLKQSEKYDKHFKQVHTRYGQQQKKKRDHQKQEAYKLRKELISFYQKEAERKKKAQKQQVSVGTCYQNALERINSIHRKNEEYAQKAEEQLEKSLKKNSNIDFNIRKKKRAISLRNKEKQSIIEDHEHILEEKLQRYINNYGQNEDLAIKAFEHKGEDCQKAKKRIQQFFKKRLEKWRQEKKRVDAAAAQVPEKCLGILDKSTKASFRHTVSSFRESGKQFEDQVRMNKSAIKETDEMKKDQILSMHLDLRLRNTTSFKVHQKMGSMRGRAKKLAFDYL